MPENFFPPLPAAESEDQLLYQNLIRGGETTLHSHDQDHTVVSHSDTTATGAELETLTDGSETTLHSHAAEVVYSDNGDTTDIDISEVTDVTIKTTDIAGVAVGDVLIAELTGILYNNSGAARTYVITPDFDGQFDPEMSQNFDAHTTSGTPLTVRWALTPAATNEAHLVARAEFHSGGVATAVGVWAFSTTGDRMVHDLSTADLTGTITVALKIRSAAADATQGFRVVSFTVRKISST